MDTPPRNFIPTPFSYHQELELTIDSLSNQGAGVGRVDNWVIFVPYTLPGERVRVRVYRNEKNCEYAVLVSLLEIDNELYNNGIVDVSYKYPKMYVIRPQFFIPMITLLRNAALNALHYKQELQKVRNQQIDISRFEENMETFKQGFARNFRLASEKFQTAIGEIDKTIEHLQKIKNNLLSSENNLRLANEKAEDLTIKKLTKNAPAVKAMFDELK